MHVNVFVCIYTYVPVSCRSQRITLGVIPQAPGFEMPSLALAFMFLTVFEF